MNMSTDRLPAKTSWSALRQIFVMLVPLLGFTAYAGCSSGARTSDSRSDVAAQPTSSGGAAALGALNLTGGFTTAGTEGAQQPCAGANCGAAGSVGPKAPSGDADTCHTPCMARGAGCIADTDCCSATCSDDGTCEQPGGRWRRARRR